MEPNLNKDLIDVLTAQFKATTSGQALVLSTVLTCAGVRKETAHKIMDDFIKEVEGHYKNNLELLIAATS